ncbi:5,10-methylenetetrahydromethanopterin reductase (plasmid) [Mycobacterium branderi]|nr:5,10-methylenetetrahydromethanopterin reductase [Mycobacterium branderi]
MIPVGVFIASATPPEQIAPIARRAEQLGYSEVWVAEDYYFHGGLAAAAVALAATERVKVGVGVVSSVVRHPAVTAMEIATLVRCYPGRFLPAVGHGAPFLIDQMGLAPKSRLSALSECIGSIRALLAGETLNTVGKSFAFNAVALAHPPNEEVPILTGVLGPKSLQLSGRIADGTVLSSMSGSKYVEAALAHIRSGMAESGRTTHLVPTFAMFSCHTDRAAAKKAVRPLLAHYLSALGPHNSLTKPYGYGDALANMASRGGEKTVLREVPAEWVDELTVSGDPDDVAAAIRALLGAGSTSVLLSPANSATAQQELELVAKTVLPGLTALD